MRKSLALIGGFALMMSLPASAAFAQSTLSGPGRAAAGGYSSTSPPADTYYGNGNGEGGNSGTTQRDNPRQKYDDTNYKNDTGAPNAATNNSGNPGSTSYVPGNGTNRPARPAGSEQ